jgi:hypothetical protein
VHLTLDSYPLIFEEAEAFVCLSICRVLRVRFCVVVDRQQQRPCSA